MKNETPIRRQYLEIKAQHKDAILLFRLGDFYEAFDDDARLLARELDIALTSKPMGKNMRVPLAGIPYHVLEKHLATLISRGHRVAICEQTSSVPVKKRRRQKADSARSRPHRDRRNDYRTAASRQQIEQLSSGVFQRRAARRNRLRRHYDRRFCGDGNRKQRRVERTAKTRARRNRHRRHAGNFQQSRFAAVRDEIKCGNFCV